MMEESIKYISYFTGKTLLDDGMANRRTKMEGLFFFRVENCIVFLDTPTANN